MARFGMFEKGERVVVGVSGGPDSVALLVSLQELNARLCCELTVAHLDHNTRASSSRDRLFVQDLCRRQGLPFIARTLKMTRSAQRARAEEALRQARYAFFAEACRRAKSRKLALGHTADDQAETVLMRLVRGTGLYGLSAILPVLPREGYTIVRPLIEVSRHDVLEYLKGRGQAWRTDPTNRDTRYLRNKIRHDLLPYLERDFNPAVRDALAGLAQTIGADYVHLERCANALLSRCAKRRGGSVRVAAGPLLRADDGLRRTCLRLVVQGLCGHLRRLTWRHWQEVEDLLHSRPVGSEVHLPLGLRVRKDAGALVFLARAQSFGADPVLGRGFSSGCRPKGGRQRRQVRASGMTARPHKSLLRSAATPFIIIEL